MRSKFLHLWLVWLALCVLTALPVQADNSATPALLEPINQQLDAAEQALPEASADPLRLDKLATQAAALSQQAQTCINDYGQQQTQTKQAVDSLGEATPEESADVKLKRKELEKQQQQTEKTLSQCRLSSLRATTLLEETNRIRQLILKQQLFTPSPSVLAHLYAILLEPGVWKLEIIDTVSRLFQSPIQWGNLLMAILYGSAGLLAGLFWRKNMQQRHQGRALTIATSSPTLGYMWRYVLRFLPYTLFALLMALSLYIAPVGFPLLPENHLIGLTRIFGGTLLGLVLIRFIWLMSGRFPWLQNTRLYFFVSIALLLAVGSLWLGYQNFSAFLFSGVIGTLCLLLLAGLLLKIPAEIFDGLDEGRAPWQQRIRQHLGLKDKQFVPGLVWLRLTHTLTITGLAALLMLRLWGVPEQYLALFLNRLDNGFEIAGFTLEPLRIIGGLLVIALLISMTHVLKTHLADNWLQRTGLSRAAQETATTVSGYVGILLAILLGLSVAGIEFKNLAIIVGALSVGIGFGLQNIVNNFVSGLILLFERPIRKGDWIKVGNAEGYVREISIRSTTIQTFDHSDIIVPNSDIISGQVTNMMLTDNMGRIIVPINAASGSDAEQVMRILREAAEAHPAVIKDRSNMKINVLFRGFGENGLNFELRCFIREIETRFTIASDLNLAINKAFRQQHIEMPLPQRTIHLLPPETEPAKPTKTPDSSAKQVDLR
ncbi:MAG: mechanosensitive ion channel [Thiothrix sp.]|uniref:mechanosensitive ion channel family protein n=1 Tax=Thiothrix sp. TaxID=1032 RepID=UPI00260B0B62|nr:mechanosensitive ion channel domain-containing protein [Thiothrix sp.]MDD5392717.1 mechanosensitive ion channel [Thiothrix sp.]